jgi:hypothetical protein
VDASADVKTQDAKATDATTSDTSTSDATDDAALEANAPDGPNDSASDPDACTHICFGQPMPCSFPCYV